MNSNLPAYNSKWLQSARWKKVEFDKGLLGASSYVRRRKGGIMRGGNRRAEERGRERKGRKRRGGELTHQLFSYRFWAAL